MKVLGLQFLEKGVYVGGQVRAGGTIDRTTHDIRPFGNGFYVVEHRASKQTYLVHASTCVAHVNLNEDEDDAASPAGSRALPGRGGKASKPAEVPPG